MVTVTQLVAQKKNFERISVFIDGKFFCSLAIDDIVKNGLVAGMELGEAELSHILSLSGENDAFNKALVYILKSPRTESEIRCFLSRKKGFSPEVTDRIINRLKTMNYINDEAYAKMFAATKHVKMSIRAIKQKLRTKGLSGELADSATESAGDQSDLACSIAEKYMRYREYDQLNLQRLFRYLASKGFEYETVHEIVEEYKTRSEPDVETCAKYRVFHDEYLRSKEELKDAKQEARFKKKRFKQYKKEITSSISKKGG
jgi:regulatory protein